MLAILSKKTQWEAFKRPMNIIPREFFLPDSKYFYCISAKEKSLHQNKSEEINLAFLNPEKLMADIPIVIEDISITGFTGFRKTILRITGNSSQTYLVDSLMIKPNPMNTVVKQVTNAVYEIRDGYLDREFPLIARIWETQSQNFPHRLLVFIWMLK